MLLARWRSAIRALAPGAFAALLPAAALAATGATPVADAASGAGLVARQTVAPHVTPAEARQALRAWRAHGIRPDAGYPVAPNILVGIGLALENTEAPPAGADTGCRPGMRHPYPTVLVNGTFSVMQDDFAALAPTLANAGYCVFTFNYGGTPGQLVQAIGPVAQSAQTLAAFVASVRERTGAAQVDLVGHSQGGMLAEYYAKVLGGAANVHALVALSPTTHGTTLDGLSVLASTFPGATQILQTLCAACLDQLPNSAVIAALDAGPIAQPGIAYTVIETLDEFVVTPVGSSFIHEPGVKNEYVQSACPLDPVDHVDLSYDRAVFQEVENALDPAHAQTPNCFVAFPYPA